MSMEYVEGVEAPASQPDEDIIATRKHPQPRKISVTDDAGPVSHVSPSLNCFSVAARYYFGIKIDGDDTY